MAQERAAGRQGSQWRRQAGQRCTSRLQQRSNHNKAACALANKMARICYATLRDKAPYDETAQLARKTNRQSFAMPA